MLDNIRVSSAESPSHKSDVLVDLFLCDLGLLFLVYRNSYTKILDSFNALNSPNLWEVLFGKDLRLFFVKSQVSVNVESRQLFNDLLNLWL